ncbi:hypothetical protein CIPAW_16G050400 [Carya illinoinensis]|uniref:Serpin domain-containing protein n=1 Tax=Carya illinoinensis TaxID=32201 RepID=A0A8T1N432_CARIL|nr:hypothetical protein CIPAW_16G050400 [Carya illinoinensis]
MDLRQSISDQTDVSLRIANRLLLSEDGKKSNLVFSPLSIHVVLSLIAAGSKGPTLDQLLSFLKSKSSDQLSSFDSEIVSVVFTDGSASGGPRLSFANGAWLDKSLSLKSSFKQAVENFFKASLDQVDFQNQATKVISEVNSWAEKETNGLIKEVLPPGSVDGTTRLIFANALYFKGAWGEKFNASATKDYDFHLLNGSSVQVPFMTSKKKQVAIAFDGFKVLGLPYKQGLVLPFSGGDLTAMVDSPLSQNLYVSNIFQKSFIEVNEEGTEAAAASAAVVNLRSIGFAEKIDFVADHPFLYLIREDMTGTVLFIGHVLNPLAG